MRKLSIQTIAVDRISRYLLVVHVGLLSLLIVNANRGTLSKWISQIHFVPMGDKIAHFFMFGIFALLLNLALGLRQLKLDLGNSGWLHHRFLVGSMIVVCLATTEEFSQLFFHLRRFDMVDLVANIAGVILIGGLAKRKSADRPEKMSKNAKHRLRGIRAWQ